ncbi:MAG: carbohydrate binding domain-containing protein, partial [Chitinophagales bacterium]|nr:carbohydrate binding domain-containing protein [Sphingobacteriales bacterium]
NAANNEANVTGISGAGGETWHIQLNQIFTASQKDSLVVGKKYKLSFFARGASSRSLKVFFGEDGGGFAALLQKSYTLTTSMTKYEDTFTLTSKFGAMKLGFEGGLSNVDFYIDDVSLVADPYVVPSPSTFPTVAAPTPPARLPSNVVSIFSGAYTNISPINYDAGWCGAPSIEKTTAGGDSVIAFKDKNCQGIDFGSATQNLTGFTHIHVDLFIASGTNLVGKVFNLKVVPTSGAESEFPIDINSLSPAPVPGTWYSYDVPVSFSGPVSSIKEFGITSNVNNAMWYDNLYFYKNAITPPPTGLTPAPTPTRAAANVISVFSDAYTSPSTVNTNPSWGQSTQSTQFQISGNNTILFKNLNYQGIVFNDTNYRMNLTAAGMTHLHIDYQTKQTGTLKMFLISPGPKEVSYNLAIPTTGWNSLDIPLTSFPAPVDLSQLFQLKFDNGGGAQLADSILIDNIYFFKDAVTPPSAVLQLPITFEETALNYAFSDFGGASASKVTNPHSGGINTSSSVGKLIKGSGAEKWAGSYLQLPNPINFAGAKGIKVKVYSPKANIKVRLKLENATNDQIFVETDQTLTTANAWQELKYTFNNLNQSYHKVIIFFDFDVTGANETFFFDDIALDSTTTTPPPPPVADTLKFPLNFEKSSLYVFSPVGNSSTAIVANPYIDASNSSSLVAKTTKAFGSVPLSGASILFPSNIDLTNATSIKMQVWSPLAFIKVKVRLQSSVNPNKFIDIDQNLSMPNTWQELEFVLPRLTGSAATEYQKFVVFFDADNTGTGVDFYFDNVRLQKSTSGVSNVSLFNITIYPNPAKNFIRLESLISLDIVEIYSINGQKVLTKVMKGQELEIDIKHLSPSQYILRAYGDGKMTTINFSKE